MARKYFAAAMTALLTELQRGTENVQDGPDTSPYPYIQVIPVRVETSRDYISTADTESSSDNLREALCWYKQNAQSGYTSPSKRKLILSLAESLGYRSQVERALDKFDARARTVGEKDRLLYLSEI